MRGSAVSVVVLAACSAGPFAGAPVDAGHDAAADAAPGDAPVRADAAPDARPPSSLFQFVPSSIDFGYRPIGSFVSQVNLVINNEGNAPIHGFGLSLAGANANQLAFNPGTCTSTLPELGCVAQVWIPNMPAGDFDATITAMGTGTGPATVDVHAIGGSPLQTSWDLPFIDFGTIAVGTEAGQFVTYTNIGAVTLPPLTFHFTDEWASQYHLEDDLCSGVALAAGASCSIVIVFAPTQPGGDMDSALIGSAGSLTEIDVRGSAASSTAISLSPLTADFGTVQAPNTATLPFTVTNTGSVAATSITGVTSSGYSVASSTCTSPLAPGATCELDVQFTPTTTGPAGGSLRVSAADAGELQADFAAIAEPAQGVVLDAWSHDFGSATLDTSGSDFTFTVTNVGTTATAVTLSFDDDGADFAIVGDTCSAASLAAQASCTVDIAFAPVDGAGSLFARLHAASATNEAIAGLRGQAEPILPSGMGVTPAGFAFGSFTIGMIPSEPMAAFNKGSTPLTPAIALTGPNADQFEIANDACTGVSVAPNAECAFDVLYRPDATGSATATAVVTWGDPTASASATFTGSGTQSTGPFVTSDPNRFDFGVVAVGDQATASVPFTNHGLTTSQPVALTMEGPDNADFWFIDDTCTDAVLVHDESCTVTVVFSPTATGSRANSLTVTALGDGGFGMTLRGSGD